MTENYEQAQALAVGAYSTPNAGPTEGNAAMQALATLALADAIDRAALRIAERLEALRRDLRGSMQLLTSRTGRP